MLEQKAPAGETCDRRVFLYAVFMLESGLQDKVPHVLWGALALLRTLVGHFTTELAPVEAWWQTKNRTLTQQKKLIF